MVAKPKGCQGCPLAQSGHGYVLPVVPDWSKVDLIVIGEAPGSDEVDDGRPFVGRAGKQMHAILKHVSIDPKRVYYDNVLRCLPPLNRSGEYYPVGKDRGLAESHCKQYDQLARAPKHIPMLLVGGKALYKYFGKENISEWHGHIDILEGRVVGCTYHPSAVMRNLNLLPTAIHEVQNLLDASKNPVALLMRPKVKKGCWLKPNGKDRVIDLEWSPDRKISVVGMAQVAELAVSTFDVGPALDAIKGHHGRLIGHSIIDADFDVMDWEPANFKPETVIDTKVVAHLVHPHLAELGLLSLGALSRYYHPTQEWKLDKSDILEYNGRDCAYNYRLWEDLKADLDSTEQWGLVEKQQRLANLAVHMRRRGIKVDGDAVRSYQRDWEGKRKQLASTFPFNPNSPKQVIAWAQGQGIRLSNIQYETIERLARRYPVMERLKEYKDGGKSIKVWFDDEAATNGYIHPTFNVTGTAVARFSCAEPNCQNIPPNLRHNIVPFHDSEQLVSFDFSQIENRCVAWLAGDKQMLADFASGQDFHRLSASRIYGKAMADVTDEERKEGKITIHATNYIETAHHLATRLYGDKTAGSVAKARGLQDAYFAAYPRIRQWHEAITAQLDSGDVALRNPFGRYRCIYAQTSHERAKRGVHYLGCSSGADIVNQRVLDVWEATNQYPVLIVHDEAVYSLPKGSRGLRAHIKAILELPVEEMDGLVVPTKMKAGSNYGAMCEQTL